MNFITIYLCFFISFSIVCCRIDVHSHGDSIEDVSEHDRRVAQLKQIEAQLRKRQASLRESVADDTDAKGLPPLSSKPKKPSLIATPLVDENDIAHPLNKRATLDHHVQKGLKLNH
jgi:hypothetical protein